MPDLRQTREGQDCAGRNGSSGCDRDRGGFFSRWSVPSVRVRTNSIDLWKELQQKTREVEPLRGLDKKVPVARKQIDQFYNDRLPGEGSAISENLGKLAGQAGVKIGSIRYDMKDPELWASGGCRSKPT